MKPLRSIFSGKTIDPPVKGDSESPDSTAIPSRVPSNRQTENKATALGENEEKALEDLGDSSQLSCDQKEIETAVVDNVEPTKPEAMMEKDEEKNKEEEDVEYPTGLPLMIVVVGLCLAILLVALVSSFR